MIIAASTAVFVCYSQLSVTAEKEVDPKAETGDEVAARIDEALYTRHPFFGAQAIVPYPTAEARNRLAVVLEKYPNSPKVLLKLAQLDEKLGREEEALREMQAYVEHEPDKWDALNTLAKFFNRRAQFAAEAESLERLLKVAPAERRVEVFRELIELAERHLLDKYLTPTFYEQIVEQNPSAFEIVAQYQERLTEQGNFDTALTLLRQNRERFPEHRAEIIQKEVSLLEDMGRTKEAETVYIQAFDPFWSKELSDNFYYFLQDHDRFRSYGQELRQAFRRSPTDVSTAIRLLHYSKFAGHDSSDVFVQLEKARAARQIAWKQEELITVTRFLLAEGHAEAASRFLYTLYLQGELKPGSALRARVLYQLFALLSDAGEQRMSLTHGDMKFYQDIATADPHPGIFGGILTLILSDTNPQEEFAVQEDRAVKRFNRAAAYRIFLAYKQEYPTAPELAQMYLDIVRLYFGSNDLKVASDTLAEFEQRYGDAPEYANVALKLADCYVTVRKYDEERAVYQRILDHLGHRRVKGVALVSYAEQASASDDPQAKQQALDLKAEPTTVKPVVITYPPISNIGTNSAASTNPDSYNSYSSYALPDYLGATEQSTSVDYQTVLSRYVGSLARENRTGDILALYSGEIKKYPEEQGLYEQMLQWLGQTNMVDEQLRVYQDALRTFPSTTWQDRLARWFIRQKRTAEFETLSRELVAKVNDHDAERYLQEFVQGGVNADPSSFDAKLYVALYSLAHQRFPHNLHFVSGLLQFYVAHKQWEQWRTLVAEYYFESREVRDQFLTHLASRNELRDYLGRARQELNATATDTQALLPYKLFRADAAAWLSNYEEAIDAYRELNRLYPNSPEFAERLVSFTRSLGQHNERFLEESATISRALADAAPSVAAYRTRSGELQAELGNYDKARAEWEQLIPIAAGDEEAYLDTATIYWDYFQYDDALRTIQTLRTRMNDPTLYAFQAGVILEDKHQLRDAIPEYIKALASTEYDDGDGARARKRLVTLSKRKGVHEQIVAAFKKERSRNQDWEFVWQYSNFLNDSERWPEASALLRDEIQRSDSSAFLKRARDVFQGKEETVGQIAALNRLIATATGQRLEISYRLQLADVYSRKGQPAPAASVLNALVRKYPNNYGVLSESSDFFWRLGLRSNAIATLQSSMQRGIGRFHYLFGRKLAARHVELEQFASAQQVLEKLNREDRMNTEVFRELAKVYVRTGNKSGLRTSLQETIAAIKKEDTDPRETRQQIAQLREEMIGAFTRLGDYASAIEQHIEIINRDPDDEQYVDAAISYVRRYGGGDTLLNYYKRTAQEAFKNYRWNVVLARIYEAQGDVTTAAQQYRAAIENQPEMIELYDSLADVYTRAKDYNSAISALRKAQELSNDEPQQVKRTIAVLEKAGRQREADVERRKLPPENVKPLSVGDQFAAAAQLRNSDLKNAVETYRRAYDAFVASPFNNELRASDIAGYVQTVRSEEPLDQITRRLWELRARIASEAETPDSKNGGKARSLLQTFDGAIVEAVGGVATDKATGDELTALFRFLQEKTNTALQDGADKSNRLSVLRNLSLRAGFGSIDEDVLKSLKDRAYSQRDWTAYHNHLKALVDLYDRCGAYKRILDLLQSERSRNAQLDGFDYLRLIATNARLLGDSSLELQALREHYQKSTEQNQPVTASDPLIERYFEALWESGAAGRSELSSCAQHATRHQLQLITFLLAKEDKELVHVAIENSPLSSAWKSSRNAEVSLQLGEFEAGKEKYFAAALKWEPIGELIKQKQDTTLQLVGDDWYRLAQTYGRWLYSSGNAEQRLKSRVLLPARMENRPNDIDEQARLGRWYLERKDLGPAIEHLALATESQPENTNIIADLGSAYFLGGDRQRANQLWERLIDKQAAVDDHRLYLETLIKHNLNEQARRRLMPFLITRLKEDFADDEENGYSQSQQVEEFRSLIRVLAKSFSNSKIESARFFAAVCAAAPDNRFLPALLVRESLVPRQEFGSFYELLIKRSRGLWSYESDYSYTSLRETNFADVDAESALDQETDYKRSEPSAPRITWQMAYLDYLIEQRRSIEARRLIASIERDLQRRFARPLWLRLASIRLDVRTGRVAPAIDQLQWLVGIKTIDLDDAKPPSIERLNDAVALLRGEDRETEARTLLEASYAKGIALGRFEHVYFTGLARIAFERADRRQALLWLKSMIDLTADESKEETIASIMANRLIAAHTSTPALSEDVLFDRVSAFQLASETAGEFGVYDAAIDFRQQLLIAAPANEENRIELIRLLAASGRKDEAIQNLAATIADRNATRTLRWQAVWLTPEIARNDQSVWGKVRDGVRGLSASDSEMNTALESLSLSAAGRSDEAIKLITATETSMPNQYLSTLHAILEKTNASAGDALNSFGNALIAAREPNVSKSFGFVEDEPLEQIVVLYLKQNQTRAALKLAEAISAFQSNKNAVAQTNEAGTDPQPLLDGIQRYQTLRQRAERRKRTSHANLLAMLSSAAEQIGDLNRALEFERLRLALVNTVTERNATQARLDHLEQLQTAAARIRRISLVVDQKLVAGD